MENISVSDGLAAIGAYGILLLVADKISKFTFAKSEKNSATFFANLYFSYFEYQGAAIYILGLLFISSRVTAIVIKSPVVFNNPLFNNLNSGFSYPINLLFMSILCLTVYPCIITIKKVNEVKPNNENFIFLLIPGMFQQYVLLQLILWYFWYLGLVYKVSGNIQFFPRISKVLKFAYHIIFIVLVATPFYLVIQGAKGSL